MTPIRRSVVRVSLVRLGVGGSGAEPGCGHLVVLEIMHHCVALPWNTKTGSLPQSAGVRVAGAGVSR
jgi:hypothetical protein